MTDQYAELLQRPRRRGSIASRLSALLGGKWHYDRRSRGWMCDDGDRHVSRVHTGGVDVNGQSMPGYGYYLYSGKEPGRRIYL